jgi:hypothetical protein
MSEDKFYRIKTKEDAHINEKLKDDGSRAALQFDQDNNLQGPVDLIEVDESEYPTREVYVEVEKEGRSFGRVILEDAVAPAVADVLTVLLTRAAEAGINAFGNWMSQKVIPVAKAKGTELVDKVRELKVTKKADMTEQPKVAIAVKNNTEVAPAPEKKESNTVIHTQEEVNQVLNNMKFAALYIAAGIRELSNTIIAGDDTNPERMLEMQTKLKELTSEDITKTIDFMLQEQNRDMLDQATVQLFEAFSNRDFILNGEAVPISRFLPAEIEEK